MAALTSLWLPLATPSRAQTAVTSVTYHFDETTISTGWTLRLESGANITYFPNVLPNPADVTWAVSSDTPPTLPTKTKLIGKLYRVTVSGVAALNTATAKPAVALPDGSQYWVKSVYYYDLAAQTWTKASTKQNNTTKKWQAAVASLDAYVALLEDRTTEEGVASWYCRRSCSSRYPTLHATSNEFSVGTKVKVTNPENGANVIVKIVSKWGQPAGRVIDLSGPAYDKLKAKNKGVTRVRVTSDLSAKADPVAAPTASVEQLPNLTVSAKTGAALAPKIGATAYQVIDAGTGTILAEYRPDTPKSIASLTKLMTAMVFLDSKPDLNKIVTYSKADVTAYAYLRVKPSETMKLKDLFYSMMVGSANNAATALARSTGKTTAQFVAAMNAKAKSWGLTDTKFVDVHGLNPKNISTASDIAIISNHAFHDYALIRQASLKTSYTFTTINTKQAHTIKTTDKLLLNPGKLAITGNKTGYLDEAKYTYVLRAKNAQGAHVLVVVLGEPTSAARFADAAKLASWAFTAFTWTS